LKKVVGNLIQLQEYDNRLNQLKLQKGDLPNLIERTNEDLTEKKEMYDELVKKSEKLKSDQKMYESEVSASKNQLKKYEDQLYQVKTNKEYDAISLEIDTKKMEIEGLENRIMSSMEEDEQIASQLSEIMEEVQNLETQFEEYQQELEEISQQTQAEENKLLSKRAEIVKQIEPRLVKQFERISEAKVGIAVASIKKASCSGCFSAIPAQKIVEVRELNRLHTCENCGRILVWIDEE
jgi:predicted  nucleic acid-binding Zn-ribbon protein